MISAILLYRTLTLDIVIKKSNIYLTHVDVSTAVQLRDAIDIIAHSLLLFVSSLSWFKHWPSYIWIRYAQWDWEPV